MKRLLCIITALDAGGAETFLMKVYRVLPEDYRLDFVVFRPDGVYEEEVSRLGGRIYNVPKHSEKPIQALRMIAEIVKNNQYENVLKLTDTSLGVLDVIAAKRGGASNLSVRSCNAAADMGRVKRIVCAVLRPALNLYTNNKVAPSELAGRFVFGNREFDRGNVSILHNGVDLNIFQYDINNREAIRRRYGLHDKFVVGNVGRFTAQKNHLFLLDVFKSILSRKPDSVLMLVGNGENEEKIQKKAEELGISNKIIYTGLRMDVASYYSAMDIYVHTAFYEGMPNTIIEAQATGLHCVISDTITKEANITGLVEYLPLSDPDQWAIRVSSSDLSNRNTQYEVFKQSGYDIESVKDNFIKLFF